MPKSSALTIDADDGALDQSGLTRFIGYHLRMAQVAVWREFGDIFAPVDLTQKQFAVMTLLRDNPGASQIDMAQIIATDRATMMAMVDRLQERNLVERRPSRQDRRRQEIHLTPAGLALMGQTDELVARHEAKVFDRFSPGEQALLREMLTRLHGG